MPLAESGKAKAKADSSPKAHYHDLAAVGQLDIPKTSCQFMKHEIPVGYTVNTNCGQCECRMRSDDVAANLACDTCTTCRYHDTTYLHGDKWWDMCNSCSCDNSTIICQQRECEGVCEYEGVRKVLGDEFNKDCNKCVCNNDGVECETKVCSCTWGDDNHVYVNHEQWVGGNWELCWCQDGEIKGACKLTHQETINSLLNGLFDFVKRLL